ncbi:hypothetical protein MIND_00897100 [Mycena indigotica]|uniref:F-box domain-containing protein n=1 Tax=Mycena indigotica TaxID=2126181 RepID=A0A8H6SIW9_9AGAR|nr:uncharacterized protein MIND_00897100 [Mycena indigotica]KAF7299471.1 hypothetical protein MIND_00897100 [Mycena indigotica]
MDVFYNLLAESATPGFGKQATSLLAEAETTLIRMETELKALSAACDFQRSRVAALKYIVAPIRILPEDLLIEIFKRVVSGSQQRLDFGFDINIRGIPACRFKEVLCLSSVCNYWRRVLLATPHLWVMPMILNASNASSAYAETTAVMLQRSFPHPVDILLHLRKPQHAMSRKLIAVVVSSALRWSSIKANFDIIPFLQNAPKGTLPHLSHVELDLQNAPAVQGNQSSSLFVDAPQLSLVSIDINGISRLQLPWSQLRQLELIDEHHPLLVLEAIAQCTSATRLKLGCNAWRADHATSSGNVVSLPHLRELELDIGGGLTMTPIFALFAFPCLKSLEIKMDGISPLSLSTAFPSFLQRSPNLEKLEISDCDLDAGELSAILLNIPSLVSLELYGCTSCVDNSFFQRLTYHEAAPNPAAPCLRRINFEYVGDDFDEQPILDMIRSRWWTDEELQARAVPPKVARWESITIWGDLEDNRDFMEEFQDEIEEISAEGLALDIQ